MANKPKSPKVTKSNVDQPFSLRLDEDAFIRPFKPPTRVVEFRTKFREFEKLTRKKFETGIRSTPPTIPAIFFYWAPGRSLAFPEVKRFADMIWDKYGVELPLTDSGRHVESAFRQYGRNLTEHPGYKPFAAADMKIVSANLSAYRSILQGSYVLELGPGTGGKTRELLTKIFKDDQAGRTVKPWAYHGVEILEEAYPELIKNLSPLLSSAWDVSLSVDDYVNNKFWANIKKLNLPQKAPVQHEVATWWGQSFGNHSDEEAVKILNHLGDYGVDEALISNDETGSWDHKDQLTHPQLKREFEQLNDAYSPPNIAPYVEWIIFSSFKMNGYQPLDHQRGIVKSWYNLQRKTPEKILQFETPQDLLLTPLPGFFQRKTGLRSSEFHTMESQKRTLNEVFDLAQQAKWDLRKRFEDPSGETRVCHYYLVNTRSMSRRQFHPG